MLFKISLLLFGCFFLSETAIQAQDSLKITEAYLLLEVDTSHQAPVPHTPNTIPFQVHILALFSDTANIDSVHIKVGRTAGGQDVAHLHIAYRDLVPTLTNCTLVEYGFKGCLATSTLSAYTLHLEIWADDKQGRSTTIYYNRVN